MTDFTVIDGGKGKDETTDTPEAIARTYTITFKPLQDSTPEPITATGFLVHFAEYMTICSEPMGASKQQFEPLAMVPHEQVYSIVRTDNEATAS